MRIVSSEIGLKSDHQLSVKESESESLRVSSGGRRLELSRASARELSLTSNEELFARNTFERPGRRLGQGQDQFEFSDLGRSLARPAEGGDAEVAAGGLQGELDIILAVIEKIFGKKAVVVDANEFLKGRDGENAGANRPGGPPANNPGRGGPSFAYDYDYSYEEKEQTSFSAGGVVRTADGKELNFQLDLNFSREYREEEHVRVRVGEQEKIDPLVINFDGNLAELTDQKFAFDLDADGTEEEISFLKGNRGFLAFDRNGDGVINDGSELFGPNTGDGFAELAEYDEDGNNFIDEGDSIFKDLKIFNRDAEGNDILESAKDRNVGAIYLGNVETPFSINTAENEVLGEVASTGIFIEEDGGVGTVQHVDLAV